MWECDYANEPMDFKLFWLLFLKKIWLFFGAVLAGALLVGGGCFVKNVVFAPQAVYRSVGEAYVDYVWEDAYGISRYHLNESVWAALVKTDLFVDNVMSRLSREGVQADREYVRESMEAALISDSRMVTTTVTANDAALSVAIGRALQEALLDFGETQEGIVGIRILTRPGEAKEVILDSRTVRMAVLGGIAGGLIGFAVMLLYFALDDSVYVPASFERRYKIPMLGTLSSKEFTENLQYLCRDCKNMAVVSVEEDTPVEAVVKDIREELGDGLQEEKAVLVLTAAGCVLEETKKAAALREADGIILAVAAGRRDGKKIERTLDFLQKQDCKVKCSILWNEDEKLLKLYYGCRRQKAPRRTK